MWQCFSKVTPIDGGNVTHILYPHELFSMLFLRFRENFDGPFGADPVKLTVFWSKFLATDHGKELSSKLDVVRGKTPHDLSHCLPLIIHGDGVPVTHKKSSMFVQWGGLMGVRFYSKHHRARCGLRPDGRLTSRTGLRIILPGFKSVRIEPGLSWGLSQPPPGVKGA